MTCDPSAPTPSNVSATRTSPLLGSQSPLGRRFRVMYILKNYPQISETYIKTEIEAVREVCDVHIIATRRANMAPLRSRICQTRGATLSCILAATNGNRLDWS